MEDIEKMKKVDAKMMKIDIVYFGEKNHNAKENFHATSMSLNDFGFFKPPTL